MALGMPIAFALIVCGVCLMFAMGLFDTQIVAQNLINGADNFPLLAVPFFILAGELMNAGGLSRKIIDIAMSLVGHIRGGLGYVTIFAAIIMASLSGSAIADTAALAALLVPMMKKAGHDVDRSCGLIAAAGILAPVIPPSIGFIIFGVAAGVSITKLFMAGIVPGILMGLSLVVAWWLVCLREASEPRPRAPLVQVAKALIRGFWALLFPVIIIGGLKFGVFTPTEAAVVAAVYAGLVGTLVYRSIGWKELKIAFVSAAKTTSVVMFLVAASMVASWLITVADLPGEAVRLLQPFMADKTLLMPPVGTVLNVVCGVARVPMAGVIRGVTPFLVAEVVVMLIMTVFPALVTVPASWFR